MRAGVVIVLATATWGGEAPPHLLNFTFGERSAQLRKTLGGAPNVVRGTGYRVLQYHGSRAHNAGRSCDGVFEWELYLDFAGTPQSLTWNAEKPVRLDKLFPRSHRRFLTNDAALGRPSVVLRELPGGRILLASVVSAEQETVQQVTLFRSGSLGRFLPWVAARL